MADKTLNLQYMRSRRQELNISLQEMAEALGFKNASTYLKYEMGDSAFKAIQLPVIAAKLNCQIENFFELNFADSANEIKDTG